MFFWKEQMPNPAKNEGMSDSLRSLTQNERPWANHSGRSQKIACLLIFSQTTSDSLRKPMSKFPALVQGRAALSVYSVVKSTIYMHFLLGE